METNDAVITAISETHSGLAPETLVLTQFGLVPVTMVLPHTRLHNPAYSPCDPAPNSSETFVTNCGSQTALRIILGYGYEIEGAVGQRVARLAEDGTIIYERLDQLTLGQFVKLHSGQHVFGLEHQPIPSHMGQWKANAKHIQLPAVMSNELAYLLGCITSEGCVHRNGVNISNSNRHILERLASIIQDVFGLDSSIYQDKRRECLFALQVNSRSLRDWFLNTIGMQQGAANKQIPVCILQSSRAEIIAFLRGLMLDGYMIASGRMFGIGLASRPLLRQLQTVLLNFGVMSRLHQTSPRAWALTVSGEALERLATFIEFDDAWKTERLIQRGLNRKVRPLNFATLLPKRVTAELRHVQKLSAKSLRRLYSSSMVDYQRVRVNLCQGDRIDRENARLLYGYFDAGHNRYLDAFFRHDRDGCLYIEVKAVLASSTEVYRVYKSEAGSCIANGVEVWCDHSD